MLNLTEIITPRDLGYYMTSPLWDRFIEAVDMYLQGGGQGAHPKLLHVIENPEMKDLLKTLRAMYKDEWRSNKKTLYRGMGIEAKKPKEKGYWSRELKPMTKKEMPRLARKKVGETFRFTVATEYPLQHWTHSLKIAESFAENASFDWHNEVVISADVPIDMVVFDTLNMSDDLMTTKMMKHVKYKEQEVIVHHDRAIICKVVQNHGH